MADIINATGLTVKTAAEITADLSTGLQGIYGNDININSNSPDGQFIGLMTQMFVDVRELIVSVNNGFDPDQAIGAILDQRVTYNHIARRGGTYTIQPVDITVSDTVTLAGLDANFADPNGTGYTVQDASGNKFILGTTATITAGVHTLNFRAAQVGEVVVPVGTITSAVTVVLGVTAINNGSAPVTVGENQETDAQLRTRRQKSVALATTGYLNGLLGAILNLPGVTAAVLYENDTGVTDANGIPPHCIWLIVAGGASPDIARAMYLKKSYGCDMRGDITYDITTPGSGVFTAKWDQPDAEDLYIRFDIKTTVTGYIFDETYIKETIADDLSYNIGEYAETSRITAAAVTAINGQGGGGVPINAEISADGMAWFDYIPTSGLDKIWTLDPSRITITVIP